MKRAHTEPALDALAEELKCPITGDLPVDPVLAEDRLVYERDAIAAWLRKADWSPLTREKIGPTLLPLRRTARGRGAAALGDETRAPRRGASTGAPRRRSACATSRCGATRTSRRLRARRRPLRRGRRGRRSTSATRPTARAPARRRPPPVGRGTSPDAAERWWNEDAEEAAEGVVPRPRRARRGGGQARRAWHSSPTWAAVGTTTRASTSATRARRLRADLPRARPAPARLRPRLALGASGAVQLAAPGSLALPTQWPSGGAATWATWPSSRASPRGTWRCSPSWGAGRRPRGRARRLRAVRAEDGAPCTGTRGRPWGGRGTRAARHLGSGERTVLCAPTSLASRTGWCGVGGMAAGRRGGAAALRGGADLAAAIDRACPERIAFVGSVVPDALRGLFVKQPRAADQLFPTYAPARDPRVAAARFRVPWSAAAATGSRCTGSTPATPGFAPHHAADACMRRGPGHDALRRRADELAAVPRRVDARRAHRRRARRRRRVWLPDLCR